MKNVLTVLIGCMLLAACAVSRVQKPIVDTRPVGDGLSFLGLAGVLAALILVFGKALGESAIMKKPFVAYLMVGLLVVLALVIALKAVPALVIPITVVAVILAGVAVVHQRWK